MLSNADRASGSLLARVSALCGSVDQGADWRLLPTADGWWIRLHNVRARCPDQGWKLHVSASPYSVEHVLDRALSVLLAEDASFKVIASVERLRALNDGEAGLSQIGKCMTVYPNDERQAVRLAVALDQATRGLRGPAIPSDCPLAPGSLVHYRYGSFAARLVQMPNGLIEWALAQPDGALLPDLRGVGYCPPEWAVDPFVAAGVAHDRAPPAPLIAGRYLVVETLSQSARGTVARAFDLRDLRRCVLKRAARDAQIDRRGQDTRDRLRHEADVLACLAPDEHIPRAFALIEHDGDLILVLEDIGGETLEQRITRLSRCGCTLSEAQVVGLGRTLAAALQAIHDRGLVYRDLKPSNVIVGPDERVHLIDFELAHGLDTASPSRGRGTRGYMSPQQAAGAPPGVADDVYSLGALLYFAATGAEPGFTPQPRSPLCRPLALLNPALGPALIGVLARCLAPDAADRPASMAAVQRSLDAVVAEATVAPEDGGAVGALPVAATCQRFRDLARRLGESLCVAAQRPGGQGPRWDSALYYGTGIWSRDLYAGSAGSLLALAALVVEFGAPDHTALLRQGVSALLRAPRPGGSTVAGLYFGEAGVALAALRAGVALGDDALIAAASERGHVVARLPWASPDVITGAAGRARLHLLLWAATADPEQLAHALAAGESLLALAEPIDDGLCWTIPPGCGSLSSKRFLGYAHGAAGIGDALLDLYEATRDERFGSAAHAAARWIIRQAIPALDDGSGACWPKQPGGEPSRALWCHGATGIGRFLLHLAQVGGMAHAADFAARAARTAAHGARWAGPTQCHGLAGNIEFLLDMFQATRSASYLDEALVLARLLEAFMIERDGLLLCQSDLPDVFTPDLMLGYGGVILCLLRLSDPERRPHQISRAGVQDRGGRVGLVLPATAQAARQSP
ncbi:MAG TPA: class IV lanthionine synthetase LanL [Herpetosiphonaceae bacterium]